MIIGVIAAVSQIIKISPLLESYPGWTWSLSNIFSLILGITIFVLGKGKFINKIVLSSLFSGKERMKRLIFSLPISAMLIIITLKVILGHDSSAYRMMNTEGGFIEYGTSIAYLIAFAFSVMIANYFMKQKQKIFGILYYLFSIALLFVGLEEISWGQRLIGLESPDFFKTFNSQEEITIHNLEWFNHYLHNIYITIGFLGSFSWYWFRDKTNNFIKYFIPDWYIASFFLPSAIVFTILEYTNGFGFFILKDQEPVELILSLGFLFFVITNFFKQTLVKNQESFK